MTKKVRFIIRGTLLVVTIVVSVFAYMQLQSPVPQNVISQTTFAIMVPKGDGIEVEPSSMKVSKPQDQDYSLLNYTARIDDIDILIGQQPTPAQFIDIPKVYEKVVEQSKQYASFETTVGTVYLTRPKDKQIAMLNAKGTYTLAQASKDLTEDQWRRFFKNIIVVN